jgi:hypothetical protein
MNGAAAVSSLWPLAFGFGSVKSKFTLAPLFLPSFHLPQPLSLVYLASPLVAFALAHARSPTHARRGWGGVGGGGRGVVALESQIRKDAMHLKYLHGFHRIRSAALRLQW